MKTLLLSLFFAAVSHALPDHPRLLVKEADWAALPARMKAEPAVKAAIAHTIARADTLLDAGNLTYILEGRRMLSVSRAAASRILCLATAWKATGDKKYFDRCHDELLKLAAFKDWHPSHHLDTAEMPTAVAIGYDWLFHDLSEEDRETIATALMEKGLKSTLADASVMTRDDNWNQVCNGGVILSALALHELDPELCEGALDKAIEGIPVALKTSYPPDGTYSEGVTYWGYGTIYSIVSLEALKGCGYDHSVIANHPGFLESGNYIVQAYGTSGTVYNYGDSSPSPRGADPAVVWMARGNRSSAISDFILPAFLSPDDGKTSRFLPFAAFWMPAAKDVKPTQTAKHFLGSGNSPIAIHRTGMGKDDLYLAWPVSTTATWMQDLSSSIFSASAGRATLDCRITTRWNKKGSTFSTRRRAASAGQCSG